MQRIQEELAKDRFDGVVNELSPDEVEDAYEVIKHLEEFHTRFIIHLQWRLMTQPDFVQKHVGGSNRCNYSDNISE